jgi:hypothetical protein
MYTIDLSIKFRVCVTVCVCMLQKKSGFEIFSNDSFIFVHGFCINDVKVKI